jgi:hypothetical protein
MIQLRIPAWQVVGSSKLKYEIGDGNSVPLRLLAVQFVDDIFLLTINRRS